MKVKELQNRVLLCKQNSHWENRSIVGNAPGNADNLAIENPVFAEFYDPKTVTFWGWKLALEPD